MTRPRTRGGFSAVLIWMILLGPASAPILAAEGATRPNYGDLGQAIAALVIFALLLAILGRFAWKPLLAQIRRREESIAEALHRSQEREKEAQELLKLYRAKMETAETEAAETVARGRKEAVDAREHVLAAAREEAAKAIAQARQDISDAKDAAVHELYATAADLAVDLTGQMIGKTLSDQDNARLVDEAIQQVRRQGREGS